MMKHLIKNLAKIIPRTRITLSIKRPNNHFYEEPISPTSNKIDYNNKMILLKIN
jgi:hypothetical protein